MAKTLQVTVRDKVATYSSRGGPIVCGNTDYEIKFNFDAEWNLYDKKTARFVWGGQHVDVPFTGNTCAVPRIHRAESVSVGVYAGTSAATTCAVISCVPSILCRSGD